MSLLLLPIRSCVLIVGIFLIVILPNELRAQSGEIADEQSAEIERLGREAAEALKGSDWPEAQRIYGEILELDPGNSLIQANLGIVEYQLGDDQAAVAYLTEALHTEPKLHLSRELLGMAYLRLGEPMRALAELSRAAADQPNEPRAFNKLAVVLQELGWLIGAEKSLRKAIELDPDFQQAHFNIALVYLDLKPPAPDLARHHYQKALQLGIPADPILEEQLENLESENPESTSEP